MSLGQRLLELRKSKQLSQEEVADILNVSRQTVSKWETDQSSPDFDKIVPLCNLYGVSTEELLTGKKSEGVVNDTTSGNEKSYGKKRAKGIGIGVFLYFVAIFWIMVSIPVLRWNPIVSAGVFLLICGAATFLIIYTCMVYKNTKPETKNDKLRKQIEAVIETIILIIYLVVSFTTMAWHITWILWVVMGLISEILKLIFMLRGNEDEE